MASAAADPLKCVNDPNFAVICAFLEKFGALCAIEHPNFADLQTMLENDEQVHADLIDLHIKLLRKIKYAVHAERWERSLVKFCYTYSMNDAWEVERFAYKLLKLPVRLRILKNLCETQFDNNAKFKTAVNTLNSGDLRPVPLGRDKMGNLYWRTLDADCNIRIYQENQDDESLKIVASNRDELAKLIAVLSGKEPMIPNLAGLVDEDSSSNSDIVAQQQQPTSELAVAEKSPEGEEENVEQPLNIAKNEGHVNKFNRPSLLSSSSQQNANESAGNSSSTSRITLLGKNNLAKINKFKLMNAKKSKFDDEEQWSDEEEEDGDNSEDEDDDMDIEPPVVGSVIQERVVYIRGEGAGKQNNSGNSPRVEDEEENFEGYGEAIEEPVMFFSGEGAGHECDVGNPGESNATVEEEKDKEATIVAAAPAPPPTSKPMFFFGRPGCLKLSPMKPAETSGGGPGDSSSKGEGEKKVSLVAYDDSNSGSGNSQDSAKEEKEEKSEVSGKHENSESVTVEEEDGKGESVNNDSTGGNVELSASKEAVEMSESVSKEAKNEIESKKAVGENESKEIVENSESESKEAVKLNEIELKSENVDETSETKPTVENANEKEEDTADEIDKASIAVEEVTLNENRVESEVKMIESEMAEDREDQQRETRNVMEGKEDEVEIATIEDPIPSKSEEVDNLAEDNMTIDKEVPQVAEEEIVPLAEKEAEEQGMEIEDEDRQDHPVVVVTEEKEGDRQVSELAPVENVTEVGKEPVFEEESIPEDKETPTTVVSDDNLPLEVTNEEMASEKIIEEGSSEEKPEEATSMSIAVAMEVDNAAHGDLISQSKEAELNSLDQEIHLEVEEKRNENLPGQAEEQEIFKEDTIGQLETVSVTEFPVLEANLEKPSMNERISEESQEMDTINSPEEEMVIDDQPEVDSESKEILHVDLEPKDSLERDLPPTEVEPLPKEPLEKVSDSFSNSEIIPGSSEPVEMKSEKLDGNSSISVEEKIPEAVEESREEFHNAIPVEASAKDDLQPKSPSEDDLPIPIERDDDDLEDIQSPDELKSVSPPLPSETESQSQSETVLATTTTEETPKEPTIPQVDERVGEGEPSLGGKSQVDEEEMERTTTEEIEPEVKAIESPEEPLEQEDEKEIEHVLPVQEKREEIAEEEKIEETPIARPTTDPESKIIPQPTEDQENEIVPEDQEELEIPISHETPPDSSIQELSVEESAPIATVPDMESIKDQEIIPESVQSHEIEQRSIPEEIETIDSSPESDTRIPEPQSEPEVQSTSESIPFAIPGESISSAIPEESLQEPETNEEKEDLSEKRLEQTPLESSVAPIPEEEKRENVPVSVPDQEQPASDNESMDDDHFGDFEEAMRDEDDNEPEEEGVAAEEVEERKEVEATIQVPVETRNELPIEELSKQEEKISPPEEEKIDIDSPSPSVPVSLPVAESTIEPIPETISMNNIPIPVEITEEVLESRIPVEDKRKRNRKVAPDCPPKESSSDRRKTSRSAKEQKRVEKEVETIPINTIEEKMETISSVQHQETVPIFTVQSQDNPPVNLASGKLSSLPIEETSHKTPVEPSPVPIGAPKVVAEEPSPVPIEEPKVAEEPQRSTRRRGRRSDPVVAAIADSEIIPEGPRTTRGQANKKESPKAAAPPPPPPRRNSRKRKTSESNEIAVKDEPKVEESKPDEIVKEKESKEEIVPEKEATKDKLELTPEEVPKVEEEPPKKSQEMEVEEEKHESEAEEEEIATPVAGKKAPARGKKGRRGRKGAAAAPAKPKPTPIVAEKMEIEAPEPVKEEPVEVPVKEEPSTVEESPSVAETPKPKKGRRANRMMGLYVDEIQPQEDAGSVRQSRRIAQIKIKEETDRRMQEEVALEKMKDSHKKKPAEASTEEDSGSEEGKVGKGKAKGKKGKKPEKEKKVKTTWHSNSNTSDEEDGQEEEEDNFGVVEEDPGSPLFKSDHEFSCESDVDGDDYVPTKMARTARKGKPDDSEEEEDNPDHACQKCGKHDHPEWILLCDTCDKGYHCSCLIPVLFIIPEGDWYCPQCQHAKLLEQLTVQLEELDNGLKIKEREDARLRRQAMNAICAENILPPDTVTPKEQQQQRQEGSRSRPGSRRQSPNRGQAGSESESSSSGSGSEDSDDMPIYKLRKRKQKVVSYRFNDYDDLINNAIHDDMRDDRDLEEIEQSIGGGKEGAEQRKAGNLGRGKDISTIMEAENEKTRKELSQSDESGSDAEEGAQAGGVGGGGGKKRAANLDSDDDSEPIRKSGNKLSSKKGKKLGGRKKNRKLNNLDLGSSDDDGSDEDFEGSSPDSDDSVEESMSSGSSDSMELAQYRKKGKNSSTTRRSVRARVKRFDRDFINDDDDDDDEGEQEEEQKVKAVVGKRKKKKEDSDFSDFDEDDDEEGSSDDLDEHEQDLDSEDLCDDSESESGSDRPWGSKKKKKSASSGGGAKVFSNKKPILSAGKVPRNPKRKGDEDEDEKPFKATVAKKKKKVIASDDDEEEEVISTRPSSSRRTRGKKINFLEVVESGSSDDGIKPGVKRPDTPPEEREQFIKRQEEIKKMLAAKNTQGAIQAATPKLEPLKLKLSGLGGVSQAAAVMEQDPNSLSTIPRNIIQSAKALDTEFVKSRESGDEFDGELPDDFNPEDMDEEDLDRMMEEGEFAVQQLKMTGQATGGTGPGRGKKQNDQKVKEVPGMVPEKSKLSSLLEPIPPISAQPPQELLAGKSGPAGYPMNHPMHMQGGVQAIPHSVIQGMPPKGGIGPGGIPPHLPPPPHLIPDGHPQQQQQQMHPHQLPPQHLQNMNRMSLLPPNVMQQTGTHPGGQMPPNVRFMHSGGPMRPGGPHGPTAMPQNVIVGPQHMQGGPSFPPFGGPPQNSGPVIPQSPVSGESPKSGQVPKKRGRKPKDTPAPVEQMQMPPTAGESGIPTTVLGHDGSAATPPKKGGGGRRKKVTPSREELQAQAAAAAAAAAVQGKSEAEQPGRGSILSERLESGSDPKQGPPPQNLVQQPPYSTSVIQRLPQPGGSAGPPPSTMAGPYPGQGGPPPRFYQHQGIGPPPPNSIGIPHHMQPPHGGERMHFMQQHSRHMGLQPPPHMYRPPTSIYGNPYQGQHAPPPHLQRPQMDPHGVRPMHPQDYSNSYLPPQFGPYIPGPHPNSHIRGVAPPPVTSAEDAKGVKLAASKIGGPPVGGPPPHPSQLAHYEALKAGAGGPMYNPPYPGHPVQVRHPGEHPQGHPDQPNRGEFSGLVSYFSSQHDDLEQQ